MKMRKVERIVARQTVDTLTKPEIAICHQYDAVSFAEALLMASGVVKPGAWCDGAEWEAATPLINSDSFEDRCVAAVLIFRSVTPEMLTAMVDGMRGMLLTRNEDGVPAVLDRLLSRAE